MDTQNIAVEVRLNNVIFKCGMCDKIYNAKLTQPYAIGIVQRLEPSRANPSILAVPINIIIICDKCYNDNKDKGLKFSEPSKIVIPTPNPADINKIAKEVLKNGQSNTRN